MGRLRHREGRQTGDPGFYTLARTAASCALSRDPGDLEAQRLQVEVLHRFRRLTEARRLAGELVAQTDDGLDHLLLGQVGLELGELLDAAAACTAAMDRRPGPGPLDCAAQVRWLTGDLEGALELLRQALEEEDPEDLEARAWRLARLARLEALDGGPAAVLLEQALALAPDHAAVRYQRGRTRLHEGDLAGARADLEASGPTVDAARALFELDPDVDVVASRLEDPRSFALWLAERDPAQAVALLEAEVVVRQDAVTRSALAYARHRVGIDTSEEARSVLASGIQEPEVLWQAGRILADPTLIRRARSMGPGLLPSQHAYELP